MSVDERFSELRIGNKQGGDVYAYIMHPIQPSLEHCELCIRRRNACDFSLLAINYKKVENYCASCYTKS